MLTTAIQDNGLWLYHTLYDQLSFL